MVIHFWEIVLEVLSIQIAYFCYLEYLVYIYMWEGNYCFTVVQWRFSQPLSSRLGDAVSVHCQSGWLEWFLCWSCNCELLSHGFYVGWTHRPFWIWQRSTSVIFQVNLFNIFGKSVTCCSSLFSAPASYQAVLLSNETYNRHFKEV